MRIELLPIKEHLHENQEFANTPDCQDSLYVCIDFYKKVGFNPPWICYYIQLDGYLVAAAAFKGKPINGKVEIAYGTFPAYQQQGIGTHIADTLVQLSLKTDPVIRITARTLMDENFSVRILRKNNFKLLGTVTDVEDGEVWEWEYEKPDSPAPSKFPPEGETF
jgi:ribosomal-protein-alanine N-acetyltransferase